MAILCEQRGWKYEHWLGCDKADFDMIYLRSFERFGKDEDQARAMQHACRERAREILIQYWKAVEALAAALLVQGIVSGREAHRIIQQAIDASVTDWRMERWNTISSFLALDDEHLA